MVLEKTLESPLDCKEIQRVHPLGISPGFSLEALMLRVKEQSEKAGLKLNIKKTKIMVSGPITSWQIEGEKWKQCQTLFFGLQNHCRW